MKHQCASVRVVTAAKPPLRLGVSLFVSKEKIGTRSFLCFHVSILEILASKRKRNEFGFYTVYTKAFRTEEEVCSSSCSCRIGFFPAEILFHRANIRIFAVLVQTAVYAGFGLALARGIAQKETY